MDVGHISDAKLLSNKPETGMSYTMGKNQLHHGYVPRKGMESTA
jgi:hypothetical protein